MLDLELRWHVVSIVQNWLPKYLSYVRCSISNVLIDTKEWRLYYQYAYIYIFDINNITTLYMCIYIYVYIYIYIYLIIYHNVILLKQLLQPNVISLLNNYFISMITIIWICVLQDYYDHYYSIIIIVTISYHYHYH